MSTTLQLKRGNKSQLPSHAMEGEPLIALDTQELFIGDSNGIPQKISDIVVSDTEPLNKLKFWWDTIAEELKRFDGTVWVIVNSKTISDLQTAVSNKVDKDVLCINVKDYGAKGDGKTDDSTAIQAAVNSVIATGGVIYFPKGVFKISTSITCNTSNNGKQVTIKGAGVGTTIISVTTDIDAFTINGYLIRISDMYIAGITGSTKSGIVIPSSGNCARIDLQYLQISGFQNGLFVSASFDQCWVDKCTFGNNSNYGIYFNLQTSGGGALLNITNTITNKNGQHGIFYNKLKNLWTYNHEKC